MAVLQKNFGDLYAEVGGFLKDDRTLADATDKAEVKRIVNDGYLMFLSERDWVFLHPKTTIVVRDSTTATATTISTVTLTVSAATFYDTMIGQTVTFDATSTGYVIKSVTSTTICVLTASAAAESSTDTLTITVDGNSRLPDNFGGLEHGFAYDTSNPYPLIRQSSPNIIRNMRSQSTGLTGAPTHYAIQPVSYTTTDGSRWELMLFPTPITDYTLSYAFRVDATEMTADAEYPIGGPKHSLTIQQAGLAVAEGISGRVDGPQMKKYQTLLQASFDRDDADQPRNLGYNSDGSDDHGEWPMRTAVIQALPEP